MLRQRRPLELVRLWRLVMRVFNQDSASFQHVPAASAPTMAAMALVRNSRTALRPVAALLIGLWILGWAAGSYLYAGRGPGGGRFDPTPITAHHRLLSRFTAQLPREAAVTATAAVHPHVSHRRHVYQFPIGIEAPGEAEWALLDVTTATDMAPGDVRATVEAMLAGAWGVVDGADGFLLLQKGAPDKTIPPAFYDFARTPGPVDNSVGESPLTLVEAGVDDWQRWRATRITSTWRVADGFDPVTMTPALELRTPGGERVAQADAALTPAMVWYPPDQWQPGDTLHLTTLPLYLPRAFGVVAMQTPGLAMLPAGLQSNGGQLVAAYERLLDGQLTALEIDPVAVPVWPFLTQTTDPVQARFDLGKETPLMLTADTAHAAIWPGAVLDLHAVWEGAEWPVGVHAFAHLRHGDATVAQQDGLPRYFVSVDSSTVDPASAAGGGWVDWRQMDAPAALDSMPEGEWRVVVGLYDPATGRRLPVVDAAGNVLGDEVEVARLTPQPAPIPDQACALIPSTCVGQPP